VAVFMKLLIHGQMSQSSQELFRSECRIF